MKKNYKLFFLIQIISITAKANEFKNVQYEDSLNYSKKEKYIIKTGVLNFLFDNVMLELEKHVKSNTSYTFKAGLIFENYQKIFMGEEGIIGYYVKTGKFFYLSPKNYNSYKGSATETEILYTRIKIAKMTLTKLNIRSLGVSLNYHYHLEVFERIIIDPYIGLGLSYYWGESCYNDDTTGPNGFPIGWVCLDVNKSGGNNYYSHFDIYDNVSFNGGIKLGLKF